MGTSVTTLHGQDATQPSLALWTKDAPEPEGFSYPHLQMRIFLKTAIAATGREGGFIYPHSFNWVFWNYCFFLNFPLAVGVTEPAIFQSLTSPSQEAMTILPEFFLVLFNVP